MAAIALVAFVVMSLAVMVLLAGRAKNRAVLAPAWLGWIGSLLVVSAFVFVSWANTGSPGAFQRNASWLADQTVYLDRLRQLPVVQDMVASLEVDTADDIRLLVDRPETHRFLAHVEQGGSISAWQLISLARPVSPWLPVALVAGLLAVSLALVASLLSLTSTSELGAWLCIGSGIVAAASVVLLLGKLPFIDTLGATDNFAVRLIAVLGEVRVAAGGWWMAVGLILLVGASVLYWVFGRSAAPEQDAEAWSQATGWPD
jgi:hypothetical protein